MEPRQIAELKRKIGGPLLAEALVEVGRIDTMRYRRVRVIFEFEYNDRGECADSVEIRYRRPWKA
jgi:hypothetical protein